MKQRRNNDNHRVEKEQHDRQFGNFYAGCMSIPGKVVHSRTFTTFTRELPYYEFPDSIPDGSDAAASRTAAYKKAPTLALLHVHGHVLQRQTILGFSNLISYLPTSLMWLPNVMNIDICTYPVTSVFLNKVYIWIINSKIFLDCKIMRDTLLIFLFLQVLKLIRNISTCKYVYILRTWALNERI